MRVINNVSSNHSSLHTSNGTVTGSDNKIYGNHNRIIGHRNKIYGNDNVIEGDGNRAFGIGNTSKGKNNREVAVPVSGKDGPPVAYAEVVNMFGGGGIIATVGSSKKKKKKDKKRERSPDPEPELQFVECPPDTQKDDPLPADYEGETCVVCTAAPRSCAVLPCMHKCVCCACGRRLAEDGTKTRGTVKCPLCQIIVERIAKVFE